ncbi:FecR family protein [Rufibacter sp. LB8]|uniref:FecR family protein n=1 Tax=Rufibacter sp. LB8 TaxID=2777781 RepID=UPI00178C5387|nr:FecR domain-containing protein [Rufibacter sp. LB8]
MTQTTTVTHHESPEWVLMAKALRGELSALEEQDFSAWLAADEQNAQFWADALETWDELGSEPSFSFSPDVDMAWEKVSRQLKFDAPVIPLNAFVDIPEAVVERTNTYTWKSTFKYAAAAVVAAGLSWVGYTNLNTADDWTQVATVAGQRKVVYLPDSSQVTLNSSTTLKYQTAFNGPERKVELTGEAFFDVRKNPEQPFVVESGDAKTQVLGTSFNVSALANQEVKVAVRTGKVSLASRTSQAQVLLTPGLTGTLAQGKVTKETSAQEGVSAWRTLSFEGETMQEVSEQLSAYFNINLELADLNLKKCTFTGTFDNPNLRDVLNVLAASADVKITQTDAQHYKMSGAGCR